MPRIRIPIVVLDPGGAPLAGATLAVRNRVTGTGVTVYAAETGATVLGIADLVSDDAGRFPGWTDRGRLEATITPPGGSGLATYIESWDAAPAGDGDVDSDWIADGSITVAELAAALAKTAQPPVVTSLPAAPADGDECYYVADATNGIVWHLKYRAADPSAYKWQVLSGAPLSSEVVVGESTTGTHTNYQDLATVGPSVVAPRPGNYIIREDAGLQTAAVAGNAAYAAARLGAAATDDNECVSMVTPVAAIDLATCARGFVRTIANAGDVIKLQYKSLTPNAVLVRRRGLQIIPIRIG